MSVFFRNQPIAREEVVNVRKPLPSASFLPKKCYGNEDFFEVEKEHVLKKNWIPVGRWDDVKERGDYFTAKVMGEAILIVRGTEGAVRCFANSCAHRGAAVAESSGNTDSFRCPYHSWTYNLDGSLKKTPGMYGAEEVDKNQCKLREISLAQWQGFIFVNLSGDAEPLAEQLGELDETLAPYRLKELRQLEPIEFKSPWDWKISLENTMEGYHYPSAHPNSIGSLFSPYSKETKLQIDEAIESGELDKWNGKMYFAGYQEAHTSSSKSTGSKSTGSKSIHRMISFYLVNIVPVFLNLLPKKMLAGLLSASLKKTKDFSVFQKYVSIPFFRMPKEIARKEGAFAVFPSLTVVLVPGAILWPKLVIDGNNKHTFYMTVLVHPDVVEKKKFKYLRESIRAVIRHVHSEDMPILKNITSGEGLGADNQGRISPLEAGIWSFHNWLVLQLEKAGVID